MKIKKKKKKLLNKYKKIIKNLKCLIIVNFNKINNNNIYKYKKQIKKNNKCKIIAIKNSIIKLLIKKNKKLKKIQNTLNNQNIMIISYSNPENIIKKINKINNTNENFYIKTVFYKKILSKNEIEKIKKLPSYENIIKKFIYILKCTTKKIILILKKIIKIKKNNL